MPEIDFSKLPYGSVVYVPSGNYCFIAEWDYDQEENRWSDTSGNANVEDDETLSMKNSDGSMEVIRIGPQRG
jgi:hypothetical protein